MANPLACLLAKVRTNCWDAQGSGSPGTGSCASPARKASADYLPGSVVETMVATYSTLSRPRHHRRKMAPPEKINDVPFREIRNAFKQSFERSRLPMTSRAGSVADVLVWSVRRSRRWCRFGSAGRSNWRSSIRRADARSARRWTQGFRTPECGHLVAEFRQAHAQAIADESGRAQYEN